MNKFWAPTCDDEVPAEDCRHAELQAVIDAVQDGIVTVDERGTIESFNPAAERIFGYQRAEMIGRNVGMLTEEEQGAHERHLHAYRQHGRSDIIGRVRELTGKRRDGSLFPVELAVTKARNTDRVMYVAIIRDITERKRAEAERTDLLERYHQAQKSEAVGTLAAWVTHDIGNILNSIMACAEHAQSLVPADHPAVAPLGDALNAGMRGRAVVEQMLDVARADSGDEHAAVELGRLVAEAATLLLHDRARDRVVVEAPAGGCRVAGRAIQLYQVAMNLLVNALQATSDTGVVRVAVRRRDAAVSGPEGALRRGPVPTGAVVSLTVEDDGCGIDPAVLPNIFTPFFTTRQEAGGTGIGLSAVEGIVRAHSGCIVVASRPGEGTRFEVLLPALP